MPQLGQHATQRKCPSNGKVTSIMGALCTLGIGLSQELIAGEIIE